MEFAMDGGNEAISKFTSNALNDLDVMLALCDAGFSSSVISFCSNKLIKNEDFVRKLIEYNDGYKIGLSTIKERTTKKIQKKFKDLLDEKDNSASYEEFISYKEDLYQEMKSQLNFNKFKINKM